MYLRTQLNFVHFSAASTFMTLFLYQFSAVVKKMQNAFWDKCALYFGANLAL